MAAATLDPSYGSPLARLRTGSWASLHAARMDDGHVAGIVAAGAADQLGPLLMGAYGLSEREQAVVRHLLSGALTNNIAASLHLSPYAVQDHQTDFRQHQRSDTPAVARASLLRPLVRDN